CHRHRQVERLRQAGIRFPETRVLSTATEPGEWPSWVSSDGGWLKRGDVHAIDASDVVFVRGSPAAGDAVRGVRARGSPLAVLQRHVGGTVVKFYGVGDRLIGGFAPTGTPVELEPAAVAELRTVAAASARALGLDVYGGDCVVERSGALQIIDVNDW